MKITQLLTVCLTASCLASVATAANLTKANNANNLNLTTAWTGGVVPGAADIAVWDSTVTGSVSNSMGASLSWSGVRISNPGGAITIGANTLTLGVDGIDMSAATQNLSMSNAVTIGARYQNWNVAAGRTLKVLALPSKPGTGGATEGIVEFSTTGTITLGGAALATILDSQNNPWATYGKSDWAATDASGNVIATAYTAWNASVGTAFGANADVTGSFTQTGNGGWNSIRFADPANAWTVTQTSGTTFTGRGVLVAPGCAGGTITGGFFRPNRVSTAASTSIDFIQNSTAGDLTIGANLANGSSSAPVKVVKAGPGKMILTVANGYSGGTVVHGGVLQINSGATPGGGAVLVNAGRIAFFSGNTLGVPSETLNNNCTNTVTVVAANSSLAGVANLLLNAGSSRLEFSWNNGIPLSATTGVIITTGLTNNSTATIDIFASGLAVGSYPLIKYTTLGGTGNYVIGFVPPRVTAHVVTNTVNASIDLVVDSVNQPISWATASGTWDISSTPNWKDTLLAATTYNEVNATYGKFGDAVLFEDTQSVGNPITVTLNVSASPAGVTVNAAKNYTISGAGAINGIGGLTKSGSGTLTLATANNFAGGINMNGGIVSFTSLGNLGSGGISFGGGTLQYNGNTDDISVRTVTLNAGGGTIDTAGQTVTFNQPIGVGAGGGLTKAGAGSLTLTGTNRYTGSTIVKAGTLLLGLSDTYISNSVSLIVSNGAVLDVIAKPQLTLNGAIGQSLAGSGTVNGNVVCPTGTFISPGASPGTLTMSDLTLSGGTNVLEVHTTPALRDLIVAANLTLTSGTIQLVAGNVLSNGSYKLIQYSGSLVSGPGSSGNLSLVVTGTAQPNKSLTLSEATAGEINLIVADNVNDQITWNGASSANWDATGVQNWQLMPGATPWAFTNGANVTIDEIGIGQNTVQLQSVLLPGSVTVSNETASYTFADGTGIGGGKISGTTKLVKKGPGTLILQTDNNNTGATDIQNGTLQIGNGGIGDSGSGNITNNGALVFGQNVSRQVNGVISGTGPVTQQGSATVTLAANNTYAGATTINAGGSLQVGTGGAAGTLGAGAITNGGTLIYNKTGSYSVGAINTGVSGGGALTFSGAGTATLNGGNTYQNNTTVNNGVLKLAAANVVPNNVNAPGSTGWLAVDGTGTLDVNGLDHTVNALSGNSGTAVITNSGTLATTTNVLTVLGSAGTAFNGLITSNPIGSKIALVLRGANELRLNGNNTYVGGTFVGDTATIGMGPGGAIGAGSVTLSNGTSLLIHNNGGTGAFCGNNVVIPDNSAATINSTQLGNGYNGLVFGGATATNLIAGAVSCASSGVFQHNNFFGRVIVQAGAELRFSSTTSITQGGTNATFDLVGTGVMHVRNVGAVTLGALTGDGRINNPTTSGTGTWTIGTKNVDTIYSGEFSGANVVIKSGTGALKFNGVVTTTTTDFATYTNYLYAPRITYSGNTTVNNGVLALVVPNQLTNSPTITMSSATAVLDVSQMGTIVDQLDDTLTVTNQLLVVNGQMELLTGQTLAGLGTIRGKVLADSGTTITVGQPIGTLTVTNTVTVNGTLNLDLNRTNAASAQTNDMLAATGAIVVNGPINVANLGPDLNTGDKFYLFNHGITGTWTLSLPAQNAAATITYVYQTNLVADGSITVLTGFNAVNQTPTNITSSVSGNTLTLSWPADHIGWRLQTQTNSLSTGLAGNWVNVVGSTTVNTLNFTLDPANGAVFYRMVYP